MGYRFLLFIFIFLIAACDRGKPNKFGGLRIQLPKSSNKIQSPIPLAKINPLSYSDAWGEITPQSIDEVNCYAVMVSGSELKGTSRSCTNGGVDLITAKMTAGFFVPGQEIAIDGLEAGQEITVSVLGLKARAGASCPRADGNSINKHDYSAPLILGSALTTIVQGNNEVSVSVDVSNAKVAENCGWEQAAPVYAIGPIQKTYPLNGRWNDYVQSSPSLNTHDHPDQACTGTESSILPGTCIHSGERLKSIVEGRTNCNGITATDSLNAFNWNCRVKADKVEIYSSGFQPGKGLVDLVGETSFLPMQLTMYINGRYMDRTGISLWWDNPVVTLRPDGTSPIELSNAYTIYSIPSGSISTLNILADHVGLVSKASVLPSLPLEDECNGTSNPCAISLSSTKFAWIEVSIQGAGPGIGIYADNAIQNYIRNSKISQFGVGINLLNSSHNRISNLSIAKGGRGIFSVNSSSNTLQMISLNNMSDGLYMTSSNNNIISQINSVFMSVRGISIQYSEQNLFSHINTSGAALSGFHDEFGISNQIVNMTSLNNGQGVSLSNSNNLKLVNSSLPGNGVAIQSTGSNQTQILGILNLGVSGYCSSSLGDGSVMDVNCQNSSASLSIQREDLGSPFAGRVTASESVNHHGVNPKLSVDITDWVRFENFFRAWGPNLDSILGSAVSGQFICRTTEICSIWDWRLMLGNSTLANQFGVFTAGAPCPIGATIEAPNFVGPIGGHFLANAIEILDGVNGNGNGICESGETCIFAPNLGPYQGEGPLTKQCLFEDTTNVVDVDLLSHSTNGTN